MSLIPRVVVSLIGLGIVTALAWVLTIPDPIATMIGIVYGSIAGLWCYDAY